MPVELIAVVISAFGTYTITKRNMLSKTKREILTYEIDNIFVPLCKFFKYDCKSQDFSIECANKLHELLHDIITENFKYISVELFDFEDKLHQKLQSDKFDDIRDMYLEVERYVDDTFDTLKRALSLPSITLKSKWPLMSSMNKIIFIMNTFVLPIFFFCVIAFFVANITNLVITLVFHNKVSADDYPMFIIWCLSSSVIVINFLYSENK